MIIIKQNQYKKASNWFRFLDNENNNKRMTLFVDFKTYKISIYLDRLELL